MAETDAWIADWRRITQGLAAGANDAPIVTGLPGLQAASAAFARFAEDYGRLVGPAAGASAPDPTRPSTELRALAERFVATVVSALPQAGAGRESLAALEAWSPVVAGISTDIAARFGAQLAGPSPPATLRATFDCWIDCAEAAFQHAAHSDAFVASQARLINAFVAERARQQQLVDQGARALGLPTRAEVDGLHDAVRALTRQLAAQTPGTSTGPANPAAARAGRRTRRAGRKPRP
ncbi:MAG TPA: poly(R)-hydroxyalkanoic acid synthase subunit PhaE [Steroidobacteraceae bacterium]|nr:poly(R)-hydroxyalkanoic acid synthase subunit PhaE [Steroidobacteraceae bacterium]